MTTIYYLFWDKEGEYDAFFDSKGKLIHWWHCNDASYPEEYMNGLFEAVGVKVEDVPKKLLGSANRQMQKACG